MSEETRRKKSMKHLLERTLNDYPEAHKVSERYRLMRHVLSEEYANLIKDTPRELMLQFLKDVVYLDRQVRKETEGEETEEKHLLAKRAMEDLGYTI